MLELFVTAAWKVLIAGLVLGAGLPVIFALGVRFSAAGVGATDGNVSGSGGNAGYRVIGIACFVIVALAVALGITVIVASGFGKLVSFENIWPTLVDK